VAYLSHARPCIMHNLHSMFLRLKFKIFYAKDGGVEKTKR
jgi:hypothetical protein